MTGFTPLMLSVAAGGQAIECTKLLFEFKADTTVTDSNGNTLLHIAAIY
jgi:hypothetical protein